VQQLSLPNNIYCTVRVGVEFNAPPNAFRSFQRSSQPITWLLLTNKTVLTGKYTN